MTACEVPSAPCADAKLARPVELVCFGLIVVNFVSLAAFYMQGSWLAAPDGATDFDTIWVAGRMALAGHAAAAYDWPTLKRAVESIVGHPFNAFPDWRYPPTYFFILLPLALLPYVSAFVFAVTSTFVAYLVAIRSIIGDRVGYFLAAAFPAVLANFMVGQNGFLSASLIGGTLLLMDRQPIWAGVLLGLLTYKPHLGLLFPIALLASGRWRVFATAALIAMLLAVASWAAFGGESWQAFFPQIDRAVNIEGFADWAKLQSAFGLIRTFGGSEALAWLAQTIVMLSAAAAIALLWRSRAAYEIKAAALGTGALLATPHLLMYDLVILAVPLAFLFRLGRERGFLPYELPAMGLACLLILIFPFVVAPVGFAAILVVAALIVKRAMASKQSAPPVATALPATVSKSR
jgi:arabinofuranan 3-O-arabinosyltransferase